MVCTEKRGALRRKEGDRNGSTKRREEGIRKYGWQCEGFYEIQGSVRQSYISSNIDPISKLN